MNKREVTLALTELSLVEETNSKQKHIIQIMFLNYSDKYHEQKVEHSESSDII